MRKNILITGKDSYIGSKFSEYATEYGDMVRTIDMITDDWGKRIFLLSMRLFTLLPLFTNMSVSTLKKSALMLIQSLRMMSQKRRRTMV